MYSYHKWLLYNGMGKGTICHKYWYKWREAEGQVCTAQELIFHNVQSDYVNKEVNNVNLVKFMFL